jgi:rSAM/selenodomain-associated transferase 1
MTRSIIVLAKAPVPGRVKTRLCPPCEPEQAARLAEAALADTLAAVRGVRGVDRVLALDGDPGDWLPTDFEVVRQRGDGLDERLAHAFEDTATGGLLIGMDTPQLTSHALEAALHQLQQADAVLGPSVDGGWWAIGLHEPHPAAFTGVPMSTAITHRAQRSRLHALGLRTRSLPLMRDVDDFEDALAVAAAAPQTRFAHAIREVLASLDRTSAPASHAAR